MVPEPGICIGIGIVISIGMNDQSGIGIVVGIGMVVLVEHYGIGINPQGCISIGKKVSFQRYPKHEMTPRI